MLKKSDSQKEEPKRNRSALSRRKSGRGRRGVLNRNSASRPPADRGRSGAGRRPGGGGGRNAAPRAGEVSRASASKFGNGYAQRAAEGVHEKGNPDAVRFVPLGGLEEVGRNCMFLEYKNEIVLIDVGLQFPEDETPGIDYIIPNTQYLEKKKQNIQAIILTHGHYDHIGALPHLLARLGNPVIYATSITKAIIEKRQDDFPNSPKMKIITVKNGDEMKNLAEFRCDVFSAYRIQFMKTTGC